jgi:monoamine oxidase
LKIHDWPSGCTYWVPDSEKAYELKKAQKDAMHPAKDLWVVGESVSFQQGWIEGALETAEQLLLEF